MVETTSTSPDQGEPKRLFDAMVAWCSQDVVDAVRAAERRLTAYQLRGAMRPMVSSLSELRLADSGDWMVGGPDYMPLVSAWRVMVSDFRTRIEADELHLSGVVLGGSHLAKAESISGAWAGEMEFDFDRNTITIGSRKFGAVKVSKSELPASAAQTAQPPVQPECPPSRPARGRPRFPLEELVAIAMTRLKRRQATNRGEASALIREFQALYPGRSVPAFSTVCDHVSRIYDAARQRAAPVKPLK